MLTNILNYFILFLFELMMFPFMLIGLDYEQNEALAKSVKAINPKGN
jgi:hypothetical protein